MAGAAPARSALVVSLGPASPQDPTIELGRVLADPDIGGFEVSLLVQPSGAELGQELARFLADRAAADVVLVHLAAALSIDAAGLLWFCAAAEPGGAPEAVFAAAVLERELRRCQADQILLLLDCAPMPAPWSPGDGDGAVHGPLDGALDVDVELDGQLDELFAAPGRLLFTGPTDSVISSLSRRCQPAARRPPEVGGAPARPGARPPAGSGAAGAEPVAPRHGTPSSVWVAGALLLVALAMLISGSPGALPTVVALLAGVLISRVLIGVARTVPADHVDEGHGIPFHQLYMLRRSQKSKDHFRHQGDRRL